MRSPSSIHNSLSNDIFRSYFFLKLLSLVLRYSWFLTASCLICDNLYISAVRTSRDSATKVLSNTGNWKYYEVFVKYEVYNSSSKKGNSIGSPESIRSNNSIKDRNASWSKHLAVQNPLYGVQFHFQKGRSFSKRHFRADKQRNTTHRKVTNTTVTNENITVVITTSKHQLSARERDLDKNWICTGCL